MNLTVVCHVSKCFLDKWQNEVFEVEEYSSFALVRSLERYLIKQ